MSRRTGRLCLSRGRAKRLEDSSAGEMRERLEGVSADGIRRAKLVVHLQGGWEDWVARRVVRRAVPCRGRAGAVRGMIIPVDTGASGGVELG